jgi:hypothetical protein
MKKTRFKTISTHNFEPTSDKDIFRFTDRDGNWTHYWIKSKKVFVPAVNHIIRAGYPKGERFYQYLLQSNPSDAERKLRTAGEEGSRTHYAIHDLILGRRINLGTKYPNELSQRHDPLKAEEWENLGAFVAWCEKYNPEVVLHERTLWSPTHNFAGTVDFVGTILIPEGDKSVSRELWGTRLLILIDWKTSSGIWDEYELQTAAYRKAILEYLPERIPAREYGGMWTGIVRLGTGHKQGFEMKIWSPEESEANFTLFASAYSIFLRKYGMELEPRHRNIPAEFHIDIPPVVPALVKTAPPAKKKKRRS